MSAEITKQLHSNIMAQFDREELQDYVDDYDLDSGYVYVKEWGDDDNMGKTLTYRYSFTYENEMIKVDKESKTEVIGDREYKVVENTLEKAINKLTKVLENFGPTKKEIEVIKQFDEKTNTVIEPLYIAYGEVDGHGDAYKNKEAVYQLVEAINQKGHLLQKAIAHTHKTNCFDIGEAWVIEKETMLGDLKIPALQPVVKLKYTDKAFELRKQGKLLGPSIGCRAWDAEIVKSLLDEIKADIKPKRLLAEFDFSAKASHLSLTTPSMGGPASMKNWAVVVEKSMLNEEDMKIIQDDLEEEFTPLEKQLSGSVDAEKTLSTPNGASDAGVDNTQQKTGNNNKMSDVEKTEKEIELEKQLKALQLKVASAEVEKSLKGYDLSDEVVSELAPVLAMVKEEDKAVILKALDHYKGKVEAKETEKEEIQKQLDGSSQEPNELAKQLEQAAIGESETGTERKAKGTLGQRAGDLMKQLKEETK